MPPQKGQLQQGDSSSRRTAKAKACSWDREAGHCGQSRGRKGGRASVRLCGPWAGDGVHSNRSRQRG